MQTKPFLEWVSEKYSFEMTQQDILSYKEFLVKNLNSAHITSGN